ncbi:hypothetical protein NQZ68_004049 [Dissostichus eleginoides]|nr:hypothetical protein NQZ68_004049 [Dissostichus eleginoides]
MCGVWLKSITSLDDLKAAASEKRKASALFTCCGLTDPNVFKTHSRSPVAVD